jgi:shikimate kinase
MNISLVGFMGTGKTSAGKLVAKRLGMGYVDSDEEIEKQAGAKIPEIFSKLGEPRFRDMETRAILKLSQRDNQVVSCGGGAVLREENVRALKASGPVVCLTASPEVIFGRVRHETHRPLLRVPDPLGQVRKLLAERAPFYAKADFTIDTSELSPEQVAAKVIELAKPRAGS